jgi:predicted helicase
MNIRKIIQSARSWKDLNKILESYTKSNRSKLAGDVFEYLTKLYLQTAPQYKSKLKKVYLEKEVPSSLRKKLNLPDTDEGIDLIAETNDKEYWAIQCKYRSNSNETLTIKEDLSTFNNLAFTHCKNITHGIVCATVNKPPRKLKLLKSIGFELLETWLGLDDGDLFTQIKAKAVGKVHKPIILKPRPHQVVAIKKTLGHFRSNDRGRMIMPCGTGKSLTAFWIAKKMGVKSILVAVPSLALLQQTLKVWTREFLINGIEPEWFCVCSDGTVKDEQDDFVTDTSDLGIKVDTDPKLIKQFLKKKTSKIKVVFTTYQSGRATAKGSRGFTYGLGIMDEAHKTVGSKTKEMAHLLHQKNIKIKKRVFMTATERLFRGDKDEYLSMDDPRDYGSLIYELSFKEAINAKPPIISDYKIVTFGITTPEIEEVYQSNKYLEVKKVLKDITAREFATALALRKAIKKLNIKNAISFHRSIRRADNFREQQQLISKIFPEYGKLKSYHVAGNMPTSERANQMRSFSENKGLMTNARCLTEGVDLPAIDCVCFTDPKRSKIDIVQAAGRALRLSKGKKFGYILIPIFVPDHIELVEAAEEQGYDDVAITVRALATSDRRIVEYLRAISEGRKPRGGSPIDGKISINELHKIEADEFDKAIKLKVWDKVSIGNYRSYEEAKNYAHSLNLKSHKDWYDHTKQKSFPKDIPVGVYDVYRENWKNWSDFLGKTFLSYEEVIKYARTLNLNSYKEWAKQAKSKNFPSNIPSDPSRVYKKSWVSWGDFLGTFRVAPGKKNFRSFEDAKRYVKSLGIKTKTQWEEYAKSKNRPKDIPYSPEIHYKKEWKYWGDFLGTKFIPYNLRNNMSFENAKKFASTLKIKTKEEWEKYVKSKNFPNNIPKSPYYFYKKNWKGWPDFLGKKSK